MADEDVEETPANLEEISAPTEDPSPADPSPEDPIPVENIGEGEQPQATPRKSKDKPKKPSNEENPVYVKKEEPPRNEKLFLLEFVVDRVNLDFFMTQKLRCYTGDFCIVYKFLDNGPFSICEKDFMPTKKNYAEGCTGRGNIKNGNSCLFSLNEAAMKEVSEKFFINAEVFKKIKSGDKTDKILVGRSIIRIESLYNQLMQEISEKEAGLYAKTFKDCFKLFGASNKDLVGHLNAYVRLSCFGKMIINNFQMNTLDQSVDVKANKGHYLFKYNKKLETEITPTIYKETGKRNLVYENDIEINRAGTSSSTPYDPTKPICRPPDWSMNNTKIPNCTHRLTPCCALRCDFLPKTCPGQQRQDETQTDPTDECNE